MHPSKGPRSRLYDSIYKVVRNTDKIKTNLFLRIGTSLRHYHHDSHNGHCIYSNYEYIDHYYSETPMNCIPALKALSLMIVLYTNRNTQIKQPSKSAQVYTTESARREEIVLTSKLVIRICMAAANRTHQSFQGVLRIEEG